MGEGLRDALMAALSSDYRIEQEIAGGGLSRVFVARDLHANRDVVIKVLSPDVVGGLSLERFSREIRLAATLKDPHIVPVHSAGVFDGIPYYIMSYMRGESLRSRMRSGPVPLKEAISILRDIARALAYAHRQRVIHRNIKPENVLLSYGAAVVSDFGTARALTAARGRSAGGEGAGRSSVPYGTPAYMAPEHAAGDEADARSDLYAWGVIAYELLSGAHPFPGHRTDQQYMEAHMSEPPVHLMLKLADAPDALSQIVMRCLEKEPANRPVAALELVRVLESAELMNAPRMRDEERSLDLTADARSRLTGIGLTVLLALLAFATPWLLGRIQNARQRNDVMAYVPDGTPITNVAVIPFTSGSAASAYLAAGLSDELAHALAEVPVIRVAGRQSAAAYSGITTNALQIGKSLSVGSAVSGQVTRDGSALRAHIELVNTNDGLILWSDDIVRRADDVFGLQDEMTKRVVGMLVPSMSSRAVAAVAALSRSTANPIAYDALLRGRAALDLPNRESIAAALGAFQSALAADSANARALAYDSFIYSEYPSLSSTSADSAATLAVATAAHALALDATAPDAHLAMARALQPSLRYGEAERHFIEAFRKLPGDVAAHLAHARNLAALGRLPEALAEAQLSLTLDPSSPASRETVMNIEYAMRRFEDALTDARRLARRDSASLPARMVSASSLIFTGRADSAARLLEGVPRAQARVPGVRGLRVLAYAATRRWSDATRFQDDLVNSRKRSDYDMLLVALAFGNTRRALDILEQSGRHHTDLGMVAGGLGCDPVLDAIKLEQRYRAFLDAREIRSCPGNTPWPIAPRGRRLAE